MHVAIYPVTQQFGGATFSPRIIQIVVQYLPTMSSSMSEGFFRIRVQISIVKMVDEELKIEVNELIRAANMTDSISPVKPHKRKKNI